MWWMLVATAMATDPGMADPGLVVAWRGAAARLEVVPPEGEHVAPDAPVDAEVHVGARTVVLADLGNALRRGLPLGEVRGHRVEGTMTLSLCEDGGTRCRIVDVAFDGAVSEMRRGTLPLTVHSDVGTAASEDATFAQVDAVEVVERARTAARASGRPILLDFGAVWCPPCNLLDARVFRADPPISVVGAFELAQVDVDDPSSFDLKSRYEVGGYPTLVAIEADGDELGRLVGFPGVDATVAWMDRVATRRLDRASSEDAEAAGREAWRLVRAERDDEARALLDAAAMAPETYGFRAARLHLEPSAEDVRWLAERAPTEALAWVGAARGLVDGDPGLAEPVRSALRRAVVTASPLDAADLLYMLVWFTDDPEVQRAQYAAAAALVRGELTGDLHDDKGLLGFLATLTARAGAFDEAMALVDRGRAAFPGEPTFHVRAARLYREAGKLDLARDAAAEALDVAWGDNRLTAAILKVEILREMGSDLAARQLAEAILAEGPAPDASTAVRTHRYRRQLAEAAGITP